MNDQQPTHPDGIPADLAGLTAIGLVIIALAVVLPTTHSGALAIAGLTLVHIALATWGIRKLDDIRHATTTTADDVTRWNR